MPVLSGRWVYHASFHVGLFDNSVNFQIVRKKEDITEINEYLCRNDFISASISAVYESSSNDSELEEYLNQVLTNVHGNLWEIEKLVSFLDSTRDDEKKGNIIQYQLRMMTNKVIICGRFCMLI